MLVVETNNYTFRYYGEMAITITEDRVYIDARASRTLLDDVSMNCWHSDVHDQFLPDQIVSIRGTDAENI